MLVCANSCHPWSSALLFRKCKSHEEVNQIHAQLLTTGLIKNSSFTAKLILGFCSSPHAPMVEFARYVFFSHQALKNPRNIDDPFLWNAIIKSFSHGTEPRKGLVVFCSMLENGVSVDNFSFSLALKACTRAGLVKEGMQIHGLMWKFEFRSDVFMQNCLVSLYVRSGFVGYARFLFDRMSQKDSFSFNLMIDGYVKCGMIDLARELFDSMPMKMKNLVSWNSMISGYSKLEDGFLVAKGLFEKMPERDLFSWNLMIDCCLKSGNVELAHELFNLMPQKDVVTWAIMICGYAKLGRVDIARRFYDYMPERDVISCNAMMTGYVQNGYCREALVVFHDMLSQSNLRPDVATLSIALSAAAKIAQMDEGVAVHYYIEENGFIANGKLGVALIDMYAKCGSIENAFRVFEEIDEKSIEHCNAMIGALAIHGLGELAFDLFMEMERFSVEPDNITFIGVLNACGHAGLVKEGLICFEIMRRVHKMEPKLQHYGCMVDVLCRSGHIEEATKFIEDMPINPNDVVWRTLLSACERHEILNDGEFAAEHLLGLDSQNSSTYVLLSNIYAHFGLWDSVRKVRMKMKERGLKKIPGQSFIELEGSIHRFFVSDASHIQLKNCTPQWVDLYSH